MANDSRSEVASIDEAHPWSMVACAVLLFAMSAIVYTPSPLLAIIVGAGVLIAFGNVHSSLAVRRGLLAVFLAMLSLIFFLFLLLLARLHAQGRSVFAISVEDLIQSIVLPALRLAAGALAALCLVIPLLSRGGLRRVLALRLPEPLTMVVVLTLANLDAYKVATDRTITAYYASGLLGGGLGMRRALFLPSILSRIWRSVVLWLADTSDFKWTAHDVAGLISTYAERSDARYNVTRTVGIVATTGFIAAIAGSIGWVRPW